MNEETIRKMKRKVFEAMSRGTSDFMGDPSSFSKAADRVKDQMVRSLERFPKLLPLGLHVIPVDGLPQNCVAVLRLKDDGTFDFDVTNDPEEGKVTVSFNLDVVEVVCIDEEQVCDEEAAESESGR